MSTGAVQAWLTKAEGVGVGLIGLDSHHDPLVLVFGSGYSSTGSPPPVPPTEVWVVKAPGGGIMLYETADVSAPIPSGPSFSDPNGTWLGGAGQGKVWRYSEQSGFQVVSFGSAANVVPGGSCA